MMRRMLQRRHLSDLLLETQGWTGFLKAFTRVTSGRPITEADTAEQITLLACLIAEGCNIGLSDMAVASAGLNFDQLEEIYATYVREETLAQATAVLVNFQLQQPLAEAWGQGTTSSSDARVYGVPVRALNCHIPSQVLRLGRPGDRGVYTCLRSVVPFLHAGDYLPCSAGPYILDGLLYHQKLGSGTACFQKRLFRSRKIVSATGKTPSGGCRASRTDPKQLAFDQMLAKNRYPLLRAKKTSVDIAHRGLFFQSRVV
jgi:hypothetical protein